MFKVATRGNRWKYGFTTAEAAIAYANQIYQKRGVIVAVVEYAPKLPRVYCVDCGAETELDCICDDLNFADQYCDCGCHNEI